MTYESFKENLIAALQVHFPVGTSVFIQQFQRNNHILLDGLSILEPGSNISPTIYLSQYYADCQKGVPFSDIQERILRCYYSHSAIQKVDTSFFTCFARVRSRIVYKLIHYEKNKQLLEQVPYVPYLDLAIVFYCLVQEAPYQNGMILIHTEHLDYWQIGADELMSLASQNTPRLLPFCCQSLAELLMPVIDGSVLEECGLTREEVESEAVPMYVLTNRYKIHGNGCILYKNLLKKISEEWGCDICIIPSSVHETILMPMDKVESYGEMAQMICEANRTAVMPDEILSDHPYLFVRETGKITMQEGMDYE